MLNAYSNMDDAHDEPGDRHERDHLHGEVRNLVNPSDEEQGGGRGEEQGEHKVDALEVEGVVDGLGHADHLSRDESHEIHQDHHERGYHPDALHA